MSEKTRYFRIGVKAGPTELLGLFDMLSGPELKEPLKRFKLAAALCPWPDHPAVAKAKELGVRLLGTPEELEDLSSELDFVFDFDALPEPGQPSRLNRPSLELLGALARELQTPSQDRKDYLRVRHLLETIIDQINDDMILVSPEGRIVDINREVINRTGLKKDELRGRFFWELLDVCENYCELPRQNSPFWDDMREGRPSEVEQSKLDPDGRMRYYRLFAFPIRSPEGQLLYTLLLRRDVTRRIHMEQRLQQSEKLAAIGELSTFIAHEIRNPLFAIAGFANSLLRLPSLDDKAREKVSIILEESNRLDKILKSILNFARPTKSRPGEADVAEVVRQTMELMGMGCEKQGIRLEVEISQDMAKAKGDSEMLKQCLINLVKNSIEAMGEGGELRVSAGMQGQRVFLRVEDTGKGISEENLPQLFNPFFSTKDKGAGLGLAMTKKIIDELGGSVEIESQVGKGTSVLILLPPALAVPAESADEH